MKVTFKNIEQVKKAYNPAIVNKATRSAIRKLTTSVAKAISKEITKTYFVRAGDIKSVLNIRFRHTPQGHSVGFLAYASRRLSLRYFTPERGASGKATPKQRARPKVKSTRGIRLGARSRVRKTRPARIVPRGFWGRVGKGKNGAWQIFQRITSANDSKVRKLTGPSISQMARNTGALAAADKLLQDKADKVLSHELDHFIKRHAGLR